jgi:hypothetical protein
MAYTIIMMKEVKASQILSASHFLIDSSLLPKWQVAENPYIL